MVNIKINGTQLSVSPKTTVLDAAKSIGIDIPTLCYLKNINEIGACRVCVVEIVGVQKLASACNTLCEEGMEILTDSPKVVKARKTNLELILSQHNANCAYCVRNGNCKLQSLCQQYGIIGVPFKDNIEPFNWHKDAILVRDASKCIKCMRCIQVCDKIQGLNVWDIANTGSRTTVTVKDGKSIKESPCVLCGQCVVNCPVGALSEKNDVDALIDAIADKETITVVQIAPAVRGAFGRQLGLSVKDASVEKLVSAIRKMGVDYVFDTDFAADLTIMEEASEFIERFTSKKEYKYPMFTSCCPGWVRFIKSQYPDMVENLSTAKSPHQMFGALIKVLLSKKLEVDPSKIKVISVMPCISKKFEKELPEMRDEAGNKDVDIVVTTRELVRAIRTFNIDVTKLENGEFDAPFENASGAGVIFGVTGGVMEAALRTAYNMITGQNPQADAFKEMRSQEGWRDKSLNVNGNEIKIAIASGLDNARKLIEALRKGTVKYDFVEIMACPGGCVCGGGQPIDLNGQPKTELANYIDALDEKSKIRYSHENPDIIALYKEFLGEPLSEISHKLLHVEHN